MHPISLIHIISFATLLSRCGECMRLKRGGALTFQNISWYHFPKTGGTTMRSLLYKVSKLEGYNLTTVYGIPNECEMIPFSCHVGKAPYISYGHERDPFTKSKGDTLRIMMIRDPLSWLISRMQHEVRKMKTSDLKMSAALIQFGPRYFNFLGDEIRVEVMRWFNFLVKPPGKGLTTPLDYYRLLEAIGQEFRERTLILTTEHYEQSLALLARVFDTPHFQPPRTQEQSLPRINEAFEWQQEGKMASAEELKQLSHLLEAHMAVYHLALQEFHRQTEV